MFDYSRYKPEDIYLCSLSNYDGVYFGKEPFVSERNPNYIINQAKSGRVLRNLRHIEAYYHIEKAEPISDYLEVVPSYLSRSEIFKIANTVTEKDLKPKVKTMSLHS